VTSTALLPQDQSGSEGHTNEHHQHNAKYTEQREHVEHLVWGNYWGRD